MRTWQTEKNHKGNRYHRGMEIHNHRKPSPSLLLRKLIVLQACALNLETRKAS
jgi:hypothetical protein